MNFIDPYGLLFGFDAGEGYGESAAMYYANITTDPCASGLEKAGAWVGGLFASLWTPGASEYTAVTLATAGLAPYAGAAYESAMVAGELAFTGAYFTYWTAGGTITNLAYRAAPYSDAIVDATFGWFTETGPPKKAGYASATLRAVYDFITK